MSQILSSLRILIVDYRRPLQALIVVLVLLFVLDFVFRVLVIRDAGLRAFTPPAASRITPPESGESISKKLESWVPSRVVEVVSQERVITLQGIFGEGADARAALVLAVPGGPVERVRATVGQIIEGWTVDKIERGRIVLKRGEETRELLLFRPRPE